MASFQPSALSHQLQNYEGFPRTEGVGVGPASELDYHLLLAKDLKLIQVKQYQDLAQQTSEVKRMLTGLFQKLKADG